MKKPILFTVILFCCLGTSSSHTVGGTWIGQKPHKWIVEPSSSWMKSQASCYVFDSYWVLTEAYTEKVGSDVFVFKRGPGDAFPKSCDTDPLTAWSSYKDGDYDEVNVQGDILFLDSGTGNWRGLSIISLKNKKQIAVTDYHPSGKFVIKASELVYDGPLDRFDSSRADWKNVKKCVWGPEDKPAGLFQENLSGTRHINLNNGKKTVENVDCSVGPAAD